MNSLENLQSKILPRRTLLEVVLMGFALSSALLLYFIPIKSTQSDSTPLIQNAVVLPQKEQIIYGLPVRLKIPKIKVDTALEQVGLTPEGTVGVPKGPTGAAWYNLGPRPGDNGSAVITGHYGYWLNGKVGVFTNLYKLRKGDKLYVKDEKGATITFVVREFRTYGEKDVATNVFVSSDGKAHLNLITCDGIWNKILKSYPKRLVVFTDKLTIE
jgi:LPXTG-site transpeptidase (sortase) family protein